MVIQSKLENGKDAGTGAKSEPQGCIEILLGD